MLRSCPLKPESDDIRIPQQRRSRETREQILEAAEDLFRRKGYHGTNTKEIAVSGDVAVGSVYAYFKDKKQIYIEVLERYSRNIFERIKDVTIDLNPAESRVVHFEELLKLILDAHYAPELHRDLYAVFPHDEDLRRIVRDWQTKAIHQFQALLTGLGDLLPTTDIEAAAALLHTLIETLVQRITIYGTHVEGNRLVREFAVMLDRYLSPRVIEKPIPAGSKEKSPADKYYPGGKRTPGGGRRTPPRGGRSTGGTG